MKRRTSASLAIASLALATGALAQTGHWDIDPVHSNVSFSVRHMMISNVRGVFTKLKGALEGDPADVTTAKISVTIEATSIDTREPKRDDFFRPFGGRRAGRAGNTSDEYRRHHPAEKFIKLFGIHDCVSQIENLLRP